MSAKDHTFTLGIEEEFAIIDPETRELRSHIQEILEGGKVTLKEQIKPEMHQSVVELGTEICQSVVDCACPCDRTAQQTRGTRGSQRTTDCFGGHTSVFALARSTHYSRRTLSGDRQGHAAARTRQSHLRIARPCRNCQIVKWPFTS